MTGSVIEQLDADGTELIGPDGALELGARFVGGLHEDGVPAGSRILLQSPNSARLLAAVLGTVLAGFVPVVLSYRLTARERDEIAADAEPAVVLDATGLAQAFRSRPAPLGEYFRCRPMHFTSGTSGRPKGVWSGVLDERLGTALVDEECSAWGITASDRNLAIAPMSHSAPLRFPLITLMRGGSVIVPRGFDPEVSSRLIEQGAVTTSFMAPTLLQRLLGASPPARHSMRLLAHAGAPCPQHVRSHARAVFGDETLREFYGSTEGQFTICTPVEFDDRPGTVGRARPGRALRIDDTEHIWCRVPEHARFSYWRDPEKTAAAWHDDEFTVGDLGRLDDSGYLYLDGRRSDLIISGGVNVYPAEVERIVLDLPGVGQAIVFGVPDDTWGQRVCLAFNGSATETQVQQHCTERLAPYKRPKSVYRIDDFPLTHSGKIDRRSVPHALGLTT